MAINPDLNEKLRYGIQGSLSYEKTNPNTNVLLYRELEKFLEGDLGLKGSGGIMANRLKGAQGIQSSFVFNSNSTRQKVQKRLDTQLTEYLQELVGDKAQSAGVSIPAYLRSQGIRGISEIGRGGESRLTAYAKDDYIASSQNPLTGSTERHIKAFLRQKGVPVNTTGGTNEGRRISAYLRPDEAEYVNSMVANTAAKLNTGSYNKGDMEAMYGSQEDRAHVKRLQAMYRNTDLVSKMQDPSVAAEIDSSIIAQHEKKKTYKERYQRLVDSGIINDDSGEKGGESAKAVFKGISSALLASGSVLKTIAGMVSSMLSVIKKIAMDMGRIIGDAAETGIDPEQADRMRRWGLKNPALTGGNEFLLMDALKEYNGKFGDITRLESNANFTSLGYNKYGGLINPMVQSAINKNPYQGMQSVFGGMASTLANGGDTMQNQMRALTDTIGSSFAKAYFAYITSMDNSKLFNKKTAGNILGVGLDPENVDKTHMGTSVNDIFNTTADESGITGNTMQANNVLGDLATIQNQLYMMLLTNMDTIIQILFSIAKGIMHIPGVDSSGHGLEAIKKAEAGMAKQGYAQLDLNSMKFRTYAEGVADDYYKSKGFKDEALVAKRNALVEGVLAGKDFSGDDAKFLSSKQGSKFLDSLAFYKSSQNKLNDMYNGKDTDFVDSGLIGNIPRHGGELSADYRKKYRNYGNFWRYTDTEAVDNTTVNGRRLSLLRQDISGEGRTQSKNAAKIQNALDRGDYYGAKALMDDDALSKNQRGEVGRELSGDQTKEAPAETIDESYFIRREDWRGLQNYREQQKGKGNNIFKKMLVPKFPKGAGFSYDFMAPLDSSYALSGVDGSDGNKGSFEFITRVEVTMNGEKIASNVKTLSEDVRRKGTDATTIKTTTARM